MQLSAGFGLKHDRIGGAGTACRRLA